jgi:hypothetical protein
VDGLSCRRRSAFATESIPSRPPCSLQTRPVTVVGLLARGDLHRRPTAPPHQVEPRPWPPGWSPFLDADQTPDDASISFDVAEFAIVDDGTRVLLHEVRGFSVGGPTERRSMVRSQRTDR